MGGRNWSASSACRPSRRSRPRHDAEQVRQREREAIRQRKRNALRDRAERGEITGKQADAKAKKLGGGPLSITPDPEGFSRTIGP